MGIRLLTEDVRQKVLKSFTISENDHYDYYLNIIQEYYFNDKRIIEKIIDQVNFFIDWYLSKSKSDRSLVPLTEWGVYYSYNLEYYKQILSKLEIIEKIVNGRNELMKIQNRLPNSIQEKLNKIPFNDWDVDEIVERCQLVRNELSSLEIKQAYEELMTVLKPLAIDNTSKNNKTIEYPPLPDCFLIKEEWDKLLCDPRIKDHYEVLLNGDFKWIHGITLLAKLAHRLMNRGKLNINIIKTGQDLARVFCPYFHVEFNPTQEKQFQPDRANSKEFDWIK